MQQILVVEPSATLRHALLRVFKPGGYLVDVVKDYAAAGRRCQDPGTYAAVVIGWPDRASRASDDLLHTLSQRACANTAVLVMAHEATLSVMDWVSARPRTGLLLWDNHQDAVRSLHKLLAFDRPPAAGQAEPARVLLVDDSPTARVRFRRLLERAGYDTVTAASPEEALQRVAEESFDLAILDYFMPEMNGDELCRRLKSQPHSTHLAVAILTSTYLDRVITDSLAAGAVECMFKNEADELFLARVDAMRRQVEATRRVEQERQRLDGILSSVGDGVYGIDQNCRINFVNPAALRILGFSRIDELLGQHPAELFHTSVSPHPEEARDAGYLYQCIEQGEAMHAVESVFTRTDGKLVQVELTVYPLRIEGAQEGAVIAFRDITERKLLEEELKWQVNHDPLTKLLNRRYFEDALDQEVRRLHRSDETSALIYLDLDRFKYINDTAGHAAGDLLLVETGHLLAGRLRGADLLARIGGDEFAIILRNVDADEAYHCAEDLRTLLAGRRFTYDERVYTVGASLGVYLMSRDTASPGEALANADIACHLAKQAGRNQTHVYRPDADSRTAMDLELGWSARLRRALDENAFTLVYQPILPLAAVDPAAADGEGGIWSHMVETGLPGDVLYEVLLRLPDSRGQAITPGAFLPTAERFNLMPEIDYWVVREALAYQGRLHQAGIRATLTVNLSAQSLDSDRLIRLVRDGLERHALEPSTLVFEITESSAIFNIDSARRLIRELSELGCRFALDDFGSGYCSFSHLKNLPVEILKIDGMFLANLTADPMDLAIIRSINDIAHSLGKKTVAEGVETAEALRLLRDTGVDYVQGYYISHPLDLVPESEEAARHDPFASGLMAVDPSRFRDRS